MEVLRPEVQLRDVLTVILPLVTLGSFVLAQQYFGFDNYAVGAFLYFFYLSARRGVIASLNGGFIGNGFA